MKFRQIKYFAKKNFGQNRKKERKKFGQKRKKRSLVKRKSLVKNVTKTKFGPKR